MRSCRYPFAPGVVEIHRRPGLRTLLRGLWRALAEHCHG
ncbi:hypothetical protein VPARA_11560 [Variovorax paradoxus]|uniref:Uncharacterized protein n=1 Tax=Variovorax paradoxus TaxID=34073 RepID=A0A0H2M5L1_VARPD|nr:hypothetical protein VPARA_11560 [Variovorax paradoxus]